MPMSAKTRERFEAEKTAYWAMRDELVKQYRGKWVAVVGGQVVAVADKASKVLEDAYQKTKSSVGFAVRVGYEHVVRKIRQISARYDDGFEPSMPLVTITVADIERERATDVEFIVDTGSDGTVLTNSVADELNLWEQTWGSAMVAGVGGEAEERDLYEAVVDLAGHAIRVQADCRDDMEENLLGRDVINEFELTVCAKKGLVRFDWVPEE